MSYQFVLPLLSLCIPLGSTQAQTFIATTPTGPIKSNQIRLAKDWKLRMGDGPLLSSDQWLSLRQEKPLPAFPTGPQIILHNGDRIPLGQMPTLKGGKILVNHDASSSEASLALGAITAVWLTAPSGPDHPERLRQFLLQEARDQDQAYLSNGDVLEGLLVGLDSKNVTIEVAGNPVVVPLSRVAYVAMSTKFPMKLRPEVTFGKLVVADGARLTLRTAECADGKVLTGETVFGAQFKVSPDRIRSLTLRNSQAKYLSELKPSAYEHQPYTGLSWPLGMDRNASGGSLRLGGSTYDTGLGMHSASKVTYALPTNAQFFEALVGLDSKLGRQGHAKVTILLDDQPVEAGTKAVLTPKTFAQAIQVKVQGAKKMTLMVERGENGDVGDHVNWADARFR